MRIKHLVYLVVGTTCIIIRMDHCTLWHICHTHTRDSSNTLVMFPSHHPTKLHLSLWGHFFQALHFVSLVAHTYLLWLHPNLTFVTLTVPTVYPVNDFKIREKKYFFHSKFCKVPIICIVSLKLTKRYPLNPLIFCVRYPHHTAYLTQQQPSKFNNRPLQDNHKHHSVSHTLWACCCLSSVGLHPSEIQQLHALFPTWTPT